ncbi:MAG TPA: hypothetical protein VKA38_14190 [Draconibacterium sp.]|nr:hypothetical protein [Draconibacterium sp.]
MKRSIIILLIVSGIVIEAFSQNSKEEFKPNGKPLALIFTNFHSDFSGSSTYPAFEITRAYLGYEYNFSKNWYSKVVLDVGDPGVGKLHRTAFLKNAFVQYKNNKFTASFGLISTTQFKVSEKIWGNRYIEKSFQDAYKFNASADLGFNLDYKFTDFISADFSVINGEGYKNLQTDSILRPGFGITVKPVKDITARVFVDNMGKDTKQQSLATFLAYTGKNVVVAAEYNYQKNHKMVEGHDIYGTSFFANWKVSKNFKLFGRFDDLKSAKVTGQPQPWQISSDGQLLMAGLEYSPVKGVKLTPNFRLWNPAVASQPKVTSLYLNCELKF